MKLIKTILKKKKELASEVKIKAASIQYTEITKLIKKFEEVSKIGVGYSNASEWTGFKNAIFLNFNNPISKRNFHELIDFLKTGKKLEKGHIDYLNGKGIFENNYDGLIKELNLYAQNIMTKATIDFSLNKKEIEEIAEKNKEELEKQKSKSNFDEKKFEEETKKVFNKQIKEMKNRRN